MDLIGDKTTGTIMVVKPRQRVAKKVLKSIKAVRRSIASANKGPNDGCGYPQLDVHVLCHEREGLRPRLRRQRLGKRS